MKVPYLPPGGRLIEIDPQNPFLEAAREQSEKIKTDNTKNKTGVVIVKNQQIVAQAHMKYKFHKFIGCIRKWFKQPTGKNYWLCPGCWPSGHAEAQAIHQAKKAGIDLHGAELYLWGHWYCCCHCWAAMQSVGINTVYLPKGAKKMFEYR